MNPECQRCGCKAIAKTADGKEWTCEQGHFWRVDALPPHPLRDKPDAINPPHYTAGKVECIDAIAAAVNGLSGMQGVCVAHVIRYLWRLHRKGEPLENARKAAWYMERLVKELGG